LFFWNAGDRARKLEAFRDDNGQRVHRALAGSNRRTERTICIHRIGAIVRLDRASFLERG
jgi:hypothetical protein